MQDAHNDDVKPKDDETPSQLILQINRITDLELALRNILYIPRSSVISRAAEDVLNGKPWVDPCKELTLQCPDCLAQLTLSIAITSCIHASGNKRLQEDEDNQKPTASSGVSGCSGCSNSHNRVEGVGKVLIKTHSKIKGKER